jgi:polysaccharide biosynthesis/export protein
MRFATGERIRKQRLNQPLVSLMHLIRKIIATGMFICFSTGMASADNSYRVNPGDVLLVYVWNEKDLTQEVLVRPDGTISIPLAGQVMAGGLSVIEVEKNLGDALTRYMKDKPTVTVAIKETRGYNIYVIGKVARPGLFPIGQPTDVMQALAMAGGLNPYAAENSIQILRRDKDGTQQAIHFRYSDVKSGEALQTNILLQSGDIVVVP